MTQRINSAVSGAQHTPMPAPEWNYAAGQRLSFGAVASESVVINSPLVRLIATQDCLYTVGETPDASDTAGSVFLPQHQIWAETITPGQKLSVIRHSTDGVLFIIPAKTNS